MSRLLLPAIAALLLSVSAMWAEDTPATTTPPAPGATEVALAPGASKESVVVGAVTNAAAAEPAKPAPTIEERLTAVESLAKTASDSVGQATFNTGDNAWLLISSVLVLMMTIPGLALFYGGLVRQKNVLGTMMQSFFHCGMVTVVWVILGFAIAFGDAGPFWGGLGHYILLDGVVWDSAKNIIPVPNTDYAPSISFATFCFFQLTFAIITPALICGAYAERMKFSAMALFSTLWLIFAYLPIAHMVWGKNGYFNWGFNNNMNGAFDFAGGTVVHISSGIAALIVALFLGKRKGYPQTPMMPHNLTYSFIGAALLWVGWFGFNGGSALSAGPLAALASCNTMFATAAASLTWPLAEWILRGKPTVLGAISGAVAGLVAITPACGFVTPGSALIIGAVSGVLCLFTASHMKRALGYDDALDAFGVHAIGGIWGALATGLFFNVDVNGGVKALNPVLYNAIVDGSHHVMPNQIKAVLVTIAISAIVTTIICLIVKLTIGLRVSEEDEETGLDLSQHDEEGYHGLAS